MDPTLRATYDSQRSLTDKAVRSLCYAPFVSLYFEKSGDVRVCCHNWKYPVGNIIREPIDEIWRNSRIQLLRSNLENYEFGSGCDFCHFRAGQGSFGNSAMARFERWPVLDRHPQWPQQMEFEISNSCNLECVMCSGQFSSAIRSRREGLPPLKRVYSDEILETLREYFPHLKNMNFVGGEPFLIVEYQRIWDMLIEDGVVVPCHVTTNGTQYNKRVERILEQIPMGIAVSIDGTRRETVESIRVNANFDEVMDNARRFRDYSIAKGTSFSLTFCLMKQNWREFGDFCLLGDDWDCDVYVNTVLYPPHFGIFTLSPAELREIAAEMEMQAPRFERVLGRNRAVWFGEFNRIREAKNHSR